MGRANQRAFWRQWTRGAAYFQKQAVALAALEAQVRERVQELKQTWERELAEGQLGEEPRKVLESLRRHWEGLTVFVDHPDARFLILAWVRRSGLASRILSGILKPLRTDWHQRYGYQPVLLETFVGIPRFTGTAYRAANWLRLGQTQGRGKLERHHRQIAPLKKIWIYSLHRGYRKILCAPS